MMLSVHHEPNLRAGIAACACGQTFRRKSGESDLVALKEHVRRAPVEARAEARRQQLAQRLADIFEDGGTVSEMASQWGVGRRWAARLLLRMARRGEVVARYDPKRRANIWRRA